MISTGLLILMVQHQNLLQLYDIYKLYPHLHIECHHGYRWEKHEDRINLEHLYKE